MASRRRSPYGADEYYLRPGASFKVAAPRGYIPEAVTSIPDQWTAYAPGISESDSPSTFSHERIHQLQGGDRVGVPDYKSIPYDRLRRDPSLKWVDPAMENNAGVPFIPETLHQTLLETGAYRFSEPPRTNFNIQETPKELESWMRLMRQYTPAGESPAEEAAYDPALMRIYLRSRGIPNPPRIRLAEEIKNSPGYDLETGDLRPKRKPYPQR